MTEDQSRTVAVAEAAALLGVARATYYSAWQAGTVPGFRVGRRILVPRLQIERMLAGEEWKTGGGK